MQCSILTPVLITRYCCETHPILPLRAPPLLREKISAEVRYAAILWRERWGREGFTFWLRLTSARKGKAKVWRWSSWILGNRRQTVISGYRLNLCVCVYKSMRDGLCPSVPRLSSGVFPLFQIPLVALDGLFDAQQEGGVPLVQAGDGVELFNLQAGWRGGNREISFFISQFMSESLTCQKHCTIWQKYIYIFFLNHTNCVTKGYYKVTFPAQSSWQINPSNNMMIVTLNQIQPLFSTLNKLKILS